MDVTKEDAVLLSGSSSYYSSATETAAVTDVATVVVPAYLTATITAAGLSFCFSSAAAAVTTASANRFPSKKGRCLGPFFRFQKPYFFFLSFSFSFCFWYALYTSHSREFDSVTSQKTSQS